MGDNYYDALRHESDGARRVGWRHRIEQAYRFEVALDVVRPADTILDVGCGLGAFAHYLAARSIDVEVVGLEQDPEFIAATTHHRVISGDYRLPQTELPHYDVAVAIGATSGAVATFESFGGLLDVCTGAHRAFCLIAIDATRVPDRAAVAADASLGFVHPRWLETPGERPSRWCPHVESITQLEFALHAARDTAPSLRTNLQRWRAACDGPWGDFTPSRRAWLAYEAALYDEAERELASMNVLDELGTIVAERLRWA